MQDRQTSTRRQALGITALAVSMAVIGGEGRMAAPLWLPPMKKPASRLAREDIARVMRLYAGEFGGGLGVR